MTRKNSRTPFGDAYQGMKTLGIDVLPLIVEKIQAKDFDLLPLFSELTNGKAHFDGNVEKRAKSLLNWWGKYKGKWLLPA